MAAARCPQSCQWWRAPYISDGSERGHSAYADVVCVVCMLVSRVCLVPHLASSSTVCTSTKRLLLVRVFLGQMQGYILYVDWASTQSVVLAQKPFYLSSSFVRPLFVNRVLSLGCREESREHGARVWHASPQWQTLGPSVCGLLRCSAKHSALARVCARQNGSGSGM